MLSPKIAPHYFRVVCLPKPPTPIPSRLVLSQNKEVIIPYYFQVFLSPKIIPHYCLSSFVSKNSPRLIPRHDVSKQTWAQLSNSGVSITGVQSHGYLGAAAAFYLLYVETLTAFFVVVYLRVLAPPSAPPPLPSPRQVVLAVQKAVMEGGARGGRFACWRVLSCGPLG